jgi:hypothetical protein
MRGLIASAACFLMILMITSTIYTANASDYQTQISWGPNITESGWTDIASTNTIVDGIAIDSSYASKLGIQSKEFQLNDTQKIVFSYTITALPYNLAYNLPFKRIKVYTNVYWLRFKDVTAATWSDPSDWVAITYIR